MADAWTYSAGSDTFTLTMDGSGSGAESRSKTFTGLTASTLYTFYLDVTQADAGMGAFLEVDGGDRATADGTTDALFVRGTTNGAGAITLRFGVTEAGAGGSGDGSDPLDYVDESAAESDGWTIAPVAGVAINVGVGFSVNGHTPSVQFLVTGSGGSSSAQMYKDYTLPVGSPVSWVVGMAKGPSAPWFDNATVRTVTGGVSAESSYNSTTAFGSRTVGADGVFRIILIKSQGFPYAHLSEDFYFAGVQVTGSFAGAGVATFGPREFCIGTGTSQTPDLTGVGSGGDEDIPDPPPGGYPPPPGGGDRPFTAYGLPTGGFGYWNGSVKKLKTTFGVNTLNETTSQEAHNFFVFGETADWLTGGVFDYNKWKAIVDSVANHATMGPLLDAAIAAGFAFGHHVIDEPYHPTRYGGPIPLTTVERMCQYSKSLWPTWPTLLRVAPTFSWITRHISGCDWLWAEYLTKRGDVTEWRDSNLARTSSLGFSGCVMGLHYAQFTGVGGRNITPSEIVHYGKILAAGTPSLVPAFGGWQFDTSWYNVPGAPDAVRQVRDYFAGLDP